MWKVCFSEKKEKISHKNKHLSLSASHIIEERLYLSFTKKKLTKLKKKIQRSLLMLDARVKLRQKAQLAELCSRWVGTNILLPFLLFFSVVCFSLREKSTRFLDIHFLCWDARALCAFVLRCNKRLTTLSLHTHSHVLQNRHATDHERVSRDHRRRSRRKAH